jgi:N-acetylgalactosamine-6-sulfatase
MKKIKLLLFFFYVMVFIGTVNLKAQQPNIVFIYADDWGWGDLSCHGSDWMLTPNIDKLASEGIDFYQFNVLNPVCSPSRVAALTGRYPSRYGINSVFYATNIGDEQPDWLDPEAPTTARFLQAAGYHTAHYGKWHMGAKTDNPSVYEYGFDEAAAYHAANTPSIDKSNVADSAVAFILRNSDRPFFLDVWIHESHTAHSPSDEALALWEDETDEQRQIYGAVISDGDMKVGQVLDALDEAGITDNTIVVFGTDNGPESTSTSVGEEGSWGSYYSIGETGGYRGQKRSLFEGGVRVPFIVRWPGHTPEGIINDTTVITAVDLLPTFCEAAGVTVPDSALCDGESLLAAFNGDTVTRTRPVYWLHTGSSTQPNNWPRLAVRDGIWKLVTTFDGSQQELHNMVTDEYEDIDNDLSEQYPEIVDSLFTMAIEWYAELPTEPDPDCISTYVEPIEIDYNLASTGTATQSSTANGCGPERAIDGNFSGALADSSVTMTNEEDEPWWEVDLGYEKAINTIAITNRSDECCISYFGAYSVQVLDSERNATYTRNGAGNDKATITVSPNGAVGRYVNIALRETGILTMAEVVLTGESSYLKLQVSDEDSEEYISGATLTLNDDTSSTTSDYGIVAFDLPQDTYTVKVSKDGYITLEQSISVASDTTIALEMVAAKQYTLDLKVTNDSTLNSISDVQFTIDGESYTTDDQGEQSITIYEGSYDYSLSKTGYYTLNDSLEFYSDTLLSVTMVQEMYQMDIAVQNAQTDESIQGASFSIIDSIYQTDAEGNVSLILPSGYYDYAVSMEGFQTLDEFINLSEDTLITIQLEIEQISGLDNTRLSPIKLYPNPVKDELHITLTDIGDIKYDILNIWGQNLRTGIIQEGDNTINFNDVPSGMYTINLYSNQKLMISKQILKQ